MKFDMYTITKLGVQLVYSSEEPVSVDCDAPVSITAVFQPPWLLWDWGCEDSVVEAAGMGPNNRYSHLNQPKDITEVWEIFFFFFLIFLGEWGGVLKLPFMW